MKEKKETAPGKGGGHGAVRTLGVAVGDADECLRREQEELKTMRVLGLGSRRDQNPKVYLTSSILKSYDQFKVVYFGIFVCFLFLLPTKLAVTVHSWSCLRKEKRNY